MLIKVNRFSLGAEKEICLHISPPPDSGKLEGQGNTFVMDLLGFSCARILGVFPHFSFAGQSPKDPVSSLTPNCLYSKATLLTKNLGPCSDDGLMGRKIWSQEETWTVQANIFWGWISDLGLMWDLTLAQLFAPCLSGTWMNTVPNSCHYRQSSLSGC